MTALGNEAASVLITGAGGFVGGNLVRHFAAQGRRVVALDLHPADSEALRYVREWANAIAWERADIRDRSALTDIFARHRVGVIVHAAAITPFDEAMERARARDVLEVNLLGTLNIVELAERFDVGRIVVVTSGAGVGLPPPGTATIDETTPAAPSSLYGISKLAQEHLVARMRGLTGRSLAAVRIAQPYGPLDRPTPERAAPSPIADWVEAAASGKELVVVDPDMARDWIYVADLAEAIGALAASPTLTHPLYNAGAGRSTRVSNVIAAIVREWPAARIRLDPGGRPNRNLRPEALRPAFAIDRLVAQTGFAPRTDICAGIANYAAWIRTRDASGRDR